MNECKSQQDLLVDRAVALKSEVDELLRLYGNFRMLSRALRATSDLVILVEMMAREVRNLSVLIDLYKKGGRDA